MIGSYPLNYASKVSQSHKWAYLISAIWRSYRIHYNWLKWDKVVFKWRKIDRNQGQNQERSWETDNKTNYHSHLESESRHELWNRDKTKKALFLTQRRWIKTDWWWGCLGEDDWMIDNPRLWWNYLSKIDIVFVWKNI